MKMLIHICCGPCAVYPVAALRRKEFELMGFFYPHNIHPWTESEKRRRALEAFSEKENLKVVYEKGYDLEGFLRKMAFRETDRCRICYFERLTAAARIAKKGKFDQFTTTMLYSKFQKHDLIRSIGESVGKAAGVEFYYEDFRAGWKQGIEASRALGLYRQSYCGCIYSEKERFCPDGKTPGV